MLQISFIIPLYNQSTYIEDCIRSILSSSIDEECMEIIVWNDGSTDGCEKIVERLSLQYPCIRLYNNTNHGVSYARNQALREAKGEYVWFVDSDDMVKSENVSRILDVIYKEMPDAILFNWESISVDGNVHAGIHPIKRRIQTSGRELYLNEYVNMAPWCYIYKRGFLIEKQIEFPIDFKTCEDILFNQKVLFFASKVLALPIMGYLYRDMNVSATKGSEYRVAQDQIRRLENEIVFFSAYGDTFFLFEVVYRNLREINVWLRKCPPKAETFESLSKSLRLRHIPFMPSLKYLFVVSMTIAPRFVYRIQKIAHHIRCALFL